MRIADFHESLSDEWTHVRVPVGRLIGTAAMQPGTLLWLDDGSRKLVGHVNAHFGTGAHCVMPSIPIVRAWRRVLDMAKLACVPTEAWATAFDLDEVVFEYAEPEEYAAVADAADKLNRVVDLDWDGTLKPGLVVQMDDGRVQLIGNTNADAGVCDAEVDGVSTYEGFEHRVVRYYQAVPSALLAKHTYDR